MANVPPNISINITQSYVLQNLEREKQSNKARPLPGNDGVERHTTKTAATQKPNQVSISSK
jgi:hypothetical protein